MNASIGLKVSDVDVTLVPVDREVIPVDMRPGTTVIRRQGIVCLLVVLKDKERIVGECLFPRETFVY